VAGRAWVNLVIDFVKLAGGFECAGDHFR
jgi:hypothetical protein